MLKNTHPDYFNSDNPDNNYSAVSFLAGKPLQSAELNEVQDILSRKVKSIGSFVVASGTITSGGEILKIAVNEVTLNAAKVACEGEIISVATSTLALSATTNNTIGIRLDETIVTAEQDPDIVEKDPKSPHFGEPTAQRVKTVGTWIVAEKTPPTGNVKFFPVLIIKGGNVISYVSNTQVQDYVASSISVYDRGVHGSYVLNGLVVSYLRDDTPNKKHVMALSSGVARIQGIEVKQISEEVFHLDTAEDDFRQVNSEPITYLSGTSLYNLRNNPVKEITKVTGTKAITQKITRGSSRGSADSLPKTPVLKIVRVFQGATEYTKGTDYVQSGDSISWAPNGNEPNPGSEYSIEYQYIDTFSGTVIGNRLSLASADTQALVNNTVLSVWYKFYLSRIDRVVMDNTTRRLKVLKGVPNIPRAVLPPTANTDSELSIATAFVTYGVAPRIDQESTVYMVPFSTIKKMNEDISKLQYNVAQLSLLEKSRAIDPVTVKKGVVVDSLANDNIRDKGRDQNALLADGKLTIGTQILGQKALNFSNIKLDVLTNPVIRKQEVRTGNQRINPYARAITLKKAYVEANPSLIYGNAWEAGYALEELPRAVQVALKLRAFEPSEEIRISLRGQELTKVNSNSSGEAVADITIPKGLNYGTYDVVAEGLRSHATGSAAITIGRNDTTYNQFMRDQLEQRQAELLRQSVDQLEKELNDLESRMEQEITQLKSRVSDLETRVRNLEASVAKLKEDIEKAFRDVGVRLDDIDSRLDALDTRLTEIAKRLPGYYVLRYVNGVSGELTPDQVKSRITGYGGTVFSNGAISFNASQGNNSIIGSLMFEMSLIATENISRTIQVLSNDDTAAFYLNGQLVAKYGIQSTVNSRPVTLNLRKGENLLQIVVTNVLGPTHLTTTGDIVDQVKVMMNPKWARDTINESSDAQRNYEEALRRAQEEAAAAERERQANVRRRGLARRRDDPVAQSFTLDSTIPLNSVDVYLTELPTQDLSVKIVETTAGQPNADKLVGYGLLELKNLQLGWNTIPMLTNTLLAKGVEYALITVTSSYEGQVAIGKVGEQSSDGYYVKTQLDSGVLFVSANENTWTAVQDSDLVYRLRTETYRTEKTVKLGSIPAESRGSDITDLKLVGSHSTSSATDVEYYIMVNGVKTPLGLNEITHVNPILPSAGDIEVFAKLTSTDASETPVVGQGMMIIWGKADTPGTYVSRSFELPNAQVTPVKLDVYLDQVVPSGTNIQVLYENNNAWVDVPFVRSETDLGDGGTTAKYSISGVNIPSTRIQIRMTTSSPFNRPEVRNIRILII